MRSIQSTIGLLVVGCLTLGTPPNAWAWTKVIAKASSRFKILTSFGGQAVLDKETGLVWERAPALPAGHPFVVEASDYWSATVQAGDPSLPWTLNLFVGNVFSSSFTKAGYELHTWCVRGGQGTEAQ